MNKKSPVQRIEELLQQAAAIAKNELGLDNIFYNERFVELFIADKLGHVYGNNTQGGDALETSTNKPTEYKAINLRNKSGNGTFQFHWLSENKVAKYKQTKNMYFAVRDGVTIKDIYQVPTKKIMPMIDKKATGSKDIGGHASFNVKKLVEQLKPVKVF